MITTDTTQPKASGTTNHQGNKMVPLIERHAAQLFEESFLLLISFGVDKFRTHVQTLSPDDQQLLFDTFRLYGLCIKKHVEEQG